jgi:hypothetical protein
LNAVDKFLQLYWQRGLQADRTVALRMLELELPRMQKHALETHLLQQLVVLKVTIFVVTRNRVALAG